MKKLIFFLLVLFAVNVSAQKSYSPTEEAQMLVYQGAMAQQWGDYNRAVYYYKRALETDQKNGMAYYLWGTALTAVANENGNEKTYKEAFEKFKKASKLEPDNAGVYNDWACSLMGLAKEKKKIKSYASQAESLLKKTEKLGSQSGAYNLACVYSLLNKKDKAIEWLNTMMDKKYKDEMQNLTRSVFDQDEDFDNIRQSNEFIEFLNKTFPHELPSNFQGI